MNLYVFCLVSGLILLVGSADRFVSSSATIAHRLGVPNMVIGLTIVAFGTSAPEMLVSINSALAGASGIAIGNAIGSNIANIGLVLGFTALVSPLVVRPRIRKHELPMLLLATAGCPLLIADGHFSRIDAIILILFLVFALVKMIHRSVPEEAGQAGQHSLGKASILFIVSLILLIGSSHLLVFGARNIAEALGVSNLLIGLTIVALGTSLPELAASVASTLKRHDDIAIGNLIGSNFFNLLIVLPLPALIKPFHLSPSVLWRDYGVMVVLTALMAIVIYIQHKHCTIKRNHGLVFLAIYVAYMILLFFTQGEGNAVTIQETH